jgi:hypothetical protein
VRQKIAEGESTAKEQGRALLKALEAQKTHTLTGYSLQRPSRPLLIIALARRGKAGVILTTTANSDGSNGSKARYSDTPSQLLHNHMR